MATLTLTDPSNGTNADATVIAANNTAIKALVNGGLQNDNIASGAGISYSKLALTGAILNADLAGSIAASKLAAYPGSASKYLAGDGTWPSVAASLLDSQTGAAAVNVTGTTEGTSNAIVTGNSITYDGSLVKVEFFAPSVTVLLGNNGTVTYVVYRDATVVQQVGPVNVRQGAAAVSGPQYFAILDTPSAGAHTYKVAAFSSAVANTFAIAADTGGTGKNGSMWMRVTRG